MHYRISHAQNFEDVMLWRALSGVAHGRYIDIGAQSPDTDSVSRLFFEAGWRGVHVDANAEYAAQLRAARPDDLVLQAAITDHDGALRFHVIRDTGLSTLSADIAGRHAAAGFDVRHVDVDAMTLDRLLELAGDGDVHWLKIDVEGGEADVLRGWRVSPARPWIIVVESTLPLSQVQSHDDWEPMLLEKGYRFAWFDGLNRFYISDAHPELFDAFVVPPNIFDDFAFSGDASAPFCRIVTGQRDEARREAHAERTARAEELAQVRDAFEGERQAAAHALADIQRLLGETEGRLAGVEHQLVEAQARLHASRDRERTLSTQLQVRAAELVRVREDLQVTEGRLDHARHEAHRWWVDAEALRNDYEMLLRSHSWRVTAPLRALRRLAADPKRYSRIYARRAVSASMRRIFNSRLRDVAASMLAKTPAVRDRLRAIAVADGILSADAAMIRALPAPAPRVDGIRPPARPDLPPAVRRTHARLRAILQETR